ncbi:hypothetical protein N9K77_01600 [bacterium]|nr:hypothetical protein [bacterium]
MGLKTDDNPIFQHIDPWAGMAKETRYRLEQRWIKLGEETTYKNRARYMLWK